MWPCTALVAYVLKKGLLSHLPISILSLCFLASMSMLSLYIADPNAVLPPCLPRLTWEWPCSCSFTWTVWNHPGTQFAHYFSLRSYPEYTAYKMQLWTVAFKTTGIDIFVMNNRRASGHGVHTCLYARGDFAVTLPPTKIYGNDGWLHYLPLGTRMLFFAAVILQSCPSFLLDLKVSCFLVLWKSFKGSQSGVDRVLILTKGNEIWSTRIGDISSKDYM